MIRVAFKDAKIPHNLVVAHNGIEAMHILKQKGKSSDVYRANLIILDLNLPKMNGREVLKEIKEDDNLKMIPIIILTTSCSEEDITETYQNHVNAYITKPVDLDQFMNVVNTINDFWLKSVELPP